MDGRTEYTAGSSQSNTPLPGDKVIFSARVGTIEQEVPGVHQFKRGLSYVVLDDAGGEWEVQIRWVMKKTQ